MDIESYDGTFNESDWEIDPLPPVSEIEKKSPEIKKPVPTNKEPAKAPSVVRSPKVFRKTPKADFVDQVQFYGGPVRRKKTFRIALLNWAAFIVDILALLAFACLATAFAAILLRSNVMSLVKSVHSVPLDWTLLSIEWILYSSICRFFLGGTLGEWSCHLRCGLPSDRINKNYVTRCLLRSSVSVIPGFQILPLISSVIGQDLLGKITGLQIYSLK